MNRRGAINQGEHEGEKEVFVEQQLRWLFHDRIEGVSSAPNANTVPHAGPNLLSESTHELPPNRKCGNSNGQSTRR